MRRVLLVLACFLASSTALVRAANMDISDPFCTGEYCPPLVGNSFTFSSNLSGGGLLQFTNGSGQDWTSLSILEQGVPAEDIQLTTNAFTNTSVTNLENGFTLLRFFGVSGDCNNALGGPDAADDGDETDRCGILQNAIFTINLNDPIDGVPPPDPNGSGGWGPDREFSATANQVPEPASLLLVGTGLMGILGGKLRRRG